MTSGSLWICYRNDVNDDANENFADNSKIKKNKRRASKSFEYKTKVIGTVPNKNNMLNKKVVISLKCFSNFWRALDLPLINCKKELEFSWSKECTISEISEIKTTPRIPANTPFQEVTAIQTIRATFQINIAKLYVPVVTLSVNDNIKFL